MHVRCYGDFQPFGIHFNQHAVSPNSLNFPPVLRGQDKTLDAPYVHMIGLISTVHHAHGPYGGASVGQNFLVIPLLRTLMPFDQDER